MVEFALVLLLLLLVMYGIVETGRLVFIYASVVSAAREGAQYGAGAGLNGTVPRYNDCTGIKAAAKKLGFIQAFQDSDIQISYDTGPGGLAIAAHCQSATDLLANGNRVIVTVSKGYAPIVPLIPFGSFTITSSSSRTLLVGIQQ